MQARHASTRASIPDLGVFVGLVDVVGGEDEQPLGFDGIEPSTREPPVAAGFFDGPKYWLDDVLAFLVELGAFGRAQSMLHRRGRRRSLRGRSRGRFALSQGVRFARRDQPVRTI